MSGHKKFILDVLEKEGILRYARRNNMDLKQLHILHQNAMESGHEDPNHHFVAADAFEESGNKRMSNLHKMIGFETKINNLGNKISEAHIKGDWPSVESMDNEMDSLMDKLSTVQDDLKNNFGWDNSKKYEQLIKEWM